MPTIISPSIQGHGQPRFVTRVFRVDRKEIGYVRFTLESYDGMAQVRTLDPSQGLIQVSMPAECADTAMGLIESLREEEGLVIDQL